ncbi:CopG family transcriptional regulator [Staphylococcus equorum]|uniref:CopG family transcriptional regulator n=1 Tax=Staphylococcus equorum TaxID=246432 RepID=UPI0024077E98|nr:CopG family transcriptional regulator [Staphylococcus equorum]MDG0826357.1 CopG family transcriptional regulator [Staphylococcus equorum]
MAFNMNNEESEKKKEALKQSNTIKSTTSNISSDGTINIPKKAPIEKKKTYTFSLLPSVRENIEKMSEENNYASSSELLNTLFDPKNNSSH